MQKGFSQNPSTCICQNSKYLKRVPDTSVIECDEIVIGTDIVSTKKANTVTTKKTNTLATNVMSTASKSCHSKKVRGSYYRPY